MTTAELFTEREQDIMQLLVEDLSNVQIAERLSLSPKTVKWYVQQIYSKLSVHSRNDAITGIEMLGLFEKTAPIRDQPQHNLPAQMTGFVGREGEQRSIAKLLAQPTCRLLTIVGPGGMGKTRLAIEAAKWQTRHFADGVVWVPLAALDRSDDVVVAIAERLRFPLRQDERSHIEQLGSYLREKNLLLVLDDFDDLLDGANVLNKLLQATSQVRILVTSREVLNLRGETVFTLNGLDVPEAEQDDTAQPYSAINLFLQSARQVDPGFDPQGEDLYAIAQVCHLVMGMPLAIELAAVWVRLLTPVEIAAEIRISFDLLETEKRDVPDRHRSIRAVFEPSWQRLTTVEQRAFMRLSVFRGGFTREAAQAVADASLRTLAALMRQSMLQTSKDRYTIHELLRQYGAERLAASDEVDATLAAHSDYYASFVVQRVPDLKGGRQIAAISEIDAEFDNIHAAWEHALTQRDFVFIARILKGVALIYQDYSRGSSRWTELRSRAYQALESQDLPLAIRVRIRGIDTVDTQFIEQCLADAMQQDDLTLAAHCHWRLGMRAFFAGDLPRSLEDFAVAIAGFQQSDEPFYVARVMWDRVFVNSHLEKVEEMAADLHECRRIRQELGDEIGLAWCYAAEGLHAFWFHHRYEASIVAMRAALVQHEKVGNRFGVALTSVWFALQRFLSGEFEEAQELGETALQVDDGHNMDRTRKLSWSVLGLLACMRGEYAESQALFKRSKTRTRYWLEPDPDWGQALAACGQGDFPQAKQALSKVADSLTLNQILPVVVFLVKGDDPARAVALLGLAFNAPLARIGWMHKWVALDQLREDLKAQLGEDAYQAAWERGKSLDPEAVRHDLLNVYIQQGEL